MTEMVKKRVHYTIDKGTAESVDYIIKKAGLTPSTIMTMVYAEIERTGEIPVSLKVSQRDLDTAAIIKASYDVPAVTIDSDEKIDAFFDDETDDPFGESDV